MGFAHRQVGGAGGETIAKSRHEGFVQQAAAEWLKRIEVCPVSTRKQIVVRADVFIDSCGALVVVVAEGGTRNTVLCFSDQVSAS